jgi:hypothetical protein
VQVRLMFRVLTSGRRAIVVSLDRIVLAWMILGLACCAGPVKSRLPPVELSVDPSSAIVAEGSATRFTAIFTPGSPGDGSLSWSVVPINGGTITSEGVYTASSTAGRYAIVATWTPTHILLGSSASGSARVEVHPVAQLRAELNPDMVQASGALQTNGVIQNGVIIGQSVPSVTSTDSNGNIQVRSGFTPPIPCTESNTDC